MIASAAATTTNTTLNHPGSCQARPYACVGSDATNQMQLRPAQAPSEQPAIGFAVAEHDTIATTYRATRDAYLKATNELKLATGPYKASRDAYVAATATYTKSLYE